MQHRITSLTLQKRNRQRVNVFLDGEYAFSLAHIVAAWLQVGQEISDEKIAQLQAEDQRETAYQQAVRFLGFRPRSVAEVQTNLRKHNISEDIIQATIQRLEEQGLLDDASFAQLWVENRSAMRPRSRRTLSYELRQHGVDPQTIDHSLDGLNDEQLAFQAARKRARRLEQLEWQDFRQKMYQYLLQRGFDYTITSQVTAQVWADLRKEEEGIE